MRTLLIILSLLFTACSASKNLKTVTDKDEPSQIVNNSYVSYKSVGNDIGDILLILERDNTFRISMMILPDPLTNEDSDSINASGKWSQTSNWIRLTFNNKKIDLNALFDNNYADDNQFQVVDERNVDINYKLNSLTIWGVVCEKIQ